MAKISDKMREWAGLLKCSAYTHTTAEKISAFADRIDATCKMVVKNGHACCGKCGHRLAGECEVEEDYYEFRPFCPDCGARVVNDGK